MQQAKKQSRISKEDELAREMRRTIVPRQALVNSNADNDITVPFASLLQIRAIETS